MNNEDKKRQERNDLSVKRLVNVFNHSNLERRDIAYVVSGFLYSIGAALVGYYPDTNKEALLLYADKPTFGSALMAQATHMKETWVERKSERKETNEHDIRRETESGESTPTLQSIQGGKGKIRSDETEPEETLVK